MLETIELDKVRFKGYAFQIEMKFTAKQCGFKIKEVPVIFVNRELGTSKMSGGIFSEAVFGSSACGSTVVQTLPEAILKSSTYESKNIAAD